MDSLFGLYGRNETELKLSVLVYLLGALVGAGLISVTGGVSAESAKAVAGTDPIDPTFLGILTTNVQVVGSQMVGGVLLAFPTVVMGLFNGIAHGIVLTQAHSEGVALAQALPLVVPHAAFELPALWISAAVGYKFPVATWRYLRERKDALLTRRELADALALSVAALVLTVVAAWIEATVSMGLAGRV